ncbi:hypothetical protein [Nocardioides sp. LML1-1-1.1]|uniref:WXG100-like domain-containing protein n=1 Tax=Nocardioides sp. LML1-1-1.1 TaxID=3135248 RepID=UPI00341840AB
MTVDIFAPTYDSAAEALIAANHDAAVLYERLTNTLSGCGSMAGDDSTSTDFAKAYDEQAQATVDALRELVDAAGNLGVLAATSIENHRKGEAAARYTAPPLLYDGCGIAQGTGEVDVPMFSVPGSEGGDGGGMPEFLDVVIDHVQGVVWPSADTSKLRTAAQCWRSAATALDLLAPGIRSAKAELADQRSPEIPLALTAVGELDEGVEGLAEACRGLASACNDYASQVDEHRDEIRDIMVQLAIEAGVTAVIGGVLSFVTAGLTGAAAVAAIGTRAAMFGARILKVLEKLRAVIRLGPLVRLGEVGVKVRKLGPVLRRLAQRTARHGKKPPKVPRRKPDEILRSLRQGSKRTKLVDSDADLQKVWDELRDGGKLLARKDPAHSAWYELEDGTRVGLRGYSTSGGRTIDIELPTGGTRRVHIEGGVNDG